MKKITLILFCLLLISCKQTWYVNSVDVHDTYTNYYLKKPNKEFRKTVVLLKSETDTSIKQGDIVKTYGKKMKKASK